MKNLARILLPLSAIMLHASPAVAGSQGISLAGQAQAQGRTFTVLGPSSDADLARLRKVLEKIDGVEQIDFVKRAGGVTLRIRGDVSQRALATAAMSAGFDLMPPQPRTYIAQGPSADADIARLRVALMKAAENSQVQVEARTGGATLRVRGEVAGPALVAAAKTAGYDLRRESSYVASGSSADANYKRLREALSKLPGADQVNLHPVTGGASVLIVGEIEEGAFTAAAKSAGYSVRSLGGASGLRQLISPGPIEPANIEKLKLALKGLPGSSEIQVRPSPEGILITVPSGSSTPDAISAAAKTAGIELRPVTDAPTTSDVDNTERITPPASGERNVDDITKVGELAPDFSLITKDGKSKISLSDSRGKKPVVLIFGSYT